MLNKRDNLANTMPVVLPKDYGIRPAGLPDACFYCGQKVGEQHKSSCVCVTRLVRLRYTYVIDKRVPWDWTQEQIEFHMNESSWCADNGVAALSEFIEVLDKKGECLCPGFEGTFIKVLNDTPQCSEHKE